MTEKEEIVEKIMEFPIKYAILRGFKGENGWDKQKLEFTELYILKDMLWDLKTLERNSKRLENGTY